MTSPSLRRFAAAVCLLATPALAQSPTPEAAKPEMATPVRADELDAAVFAEGVEGKEKVIGGADRSQAPQWVIWTEKTQAGHSGLTFGDSKVPGARHLRIGFTEAVALGSVH